MFNTENLKIYDCEILMRSQTALLNAQSSLDEKPYTLLQNDLQASTKLQGIYRASREVHISEVAGCCWRDAAQRPNKSCHIVQCLKQPLSPDNSNRQAHRTASKV
jgi:hypothetical protein